MRRCASVAALTAVVVLLVLGGASPAVIAVAVLVELSWIGTE